MTTQPHVQQSVHPGAVPVFPSRGAVLPKTSQFETSRPPLAGRNGRPLLGDRPRQDAKPVRSEALSDCDPAQAERGDLYLREVKTSLTHLRTPPGINPAFEPEVRSGA
jgi:hypothetical protein